MFLAPLQVGGALPSSPIELLTGSGATERVVLAILGVLSLLSWGIMLAKWLEIGRAQGAARRFLGEFADVDRVEGAAGLARRLPASPYTRVTERAVQFLTTTRPSGGAPSASGPAVLSSGQVEALRELLDAQAVSERDSLARWVPALASIGSVSPLIGLLGTVLGVINAFLGLASKGSGNIGAVAPGIATALVATAAALTVAIPAAFGYNVFANRLNRIERELEGYGSELIALLAREGRL
ncbi:MAG: MotA/TolQ/ExbB proton channel family protein [Gemmatimonadetes bacterium]|nr:MotA/TolQ/ExbB proton channel family protein [Gemmatimonadota bacterium]